MSLGNCFSSFCGKDNVSVHLIFLLAQQPPVGQGLLIPEVSRSHSLGLLWTSDQPVTETSIWQHTTVARDRHPGPWWDSNTQSQQVSSRRPTP